jgi:hypothetical protein
MGWDRRGYYYRVRKVDGRVVREYVGARRIAELVSQMEGIERQKRDAKREAWRQERSELDSLEAQVESLDDLADLLARAAMLAAGYRQHHRGEWRRKRDNTDD